MSQPRPRFAIAALLGCATLAVSYAATETVTPVPEGLPPDVSELVEETALNDLPIGRGVMDSLKAFDPGVPITVCFFKGKPEINARIAAVALKWNAVTPNIKLDFGTGPQPRKCGSGVYADIRVSTGHGSDWSLIGKDSLSYGDGVVASMNLASFSSTPPSPEEFQRRVLHEFGHALGFRHEHQGSDANCDFIWPNVRAYFANWSEAQLQEQMASLPYLHGRMQTEFHDDSIMTYALPADLFAAGDKSACFAKANFAIAPGDEELARQAYAPRSPAQRIALVQEIEAVAKERGLTGARLAAVSTEARLSLVSSSELVQARQNVKFWTSAISPQGASAGSVTDFRDKLGEWRQVNAIKLPPSVLVPMPADEFQNQLKSVRSGD